MKSRKLFTPGPTAVPHQVLETMARPLIHHRTPEFRAILEEATKSLQYVYRTRNPVLVLTASGSGAMEAAVVNLTRPGEKALVTVVGKFSERWREVGEAYGLDLVVLEGKWGEPIPLERVKAAFEAESDISIVLTTHCETSTGVLQDVEGISRIAHRNGALIVVDGITSLGAQQVETDGWNLDVVIGGSQKGFMTPPGLAFISVSEAAIERMERAGHPVYYFDLKRALASHEKGDTPWTPALNLVIALNEALRMMKEEGLDNVIARHTRNARAVRAAVKALRLKLFATAPANATTAVIFKDGRADDVRKHLDERYGIKIAGGQGEVKGKIIRLGHLGFYHEVDMYTLIAALEATLCDLGITDAAGKGIDALLRSYRRK
ncbi:MAG: alanine--glyoxylate aminotransferase family protein [Candidatus Krumholzibacteria bacterium]